MNKRILCIIFSLIMCAMCLSACGGQQSSVTATPDSAATVAVTVPTAADILIKTKYAELRYPGMWEDRFSYEIADGQPYTVKCFATVDSHDKVEIFDIVFGGGGALIGTLGETKISVDMKEPDFDKSWEDGQIQTVNAMQEDVNYIINGLRSEKNFHESHI